MNTKPLICLGLVLAASLSFAEYENFKSAYNEANQLRRQRAYDKALVACDEALALAKTPLEKADALARKADVYLADGRKYAPAETNFLEAAGMEGLPTRRRVSILRDLASRCYRKQGEEGYASATNVLRTALSGLAATNTAERVDLYCDLADLYFDHWQLEDARAALDAADKTPGMSAMETQRVLSTRGYIAKKMCDYEAAWGYYSRIAKLEGLRDNWRVQAFRSGADVLAILGKNDLIVSEAKRLLADPKIKWGHRSLRGIILDAYKRKRDFKAARAFAESLSTSDEKDAEAYSRGRVLDVDYSADDFKRVKEDLARYPAAFSNETALLQRIGDAFFQRNDFRSALDAYESIGYLPSRRNGSGFRSFANQLLCYVRLSLYPELIACVEENSRLKISLPKDNAAYELFALQYRSPGHPIDAKKATVLVSSLSAKEKSEALAWASRQLIAAGEDGSARVLYDLREKLYQKPKRNLAVISYVRDAPCDVGGWMSSPLVKDKSSRHYVDHPYGEKEAAYLVTDVMAETRKVEHGAPKNKADRETYFHICYDEYGIHLFFVGADSKADEIRAGARNGSGYEMYLGLGEGGPTYQWLFNQPQDKMMMPPWDSPSKYFRRMDDFVTIQSQYVPGGYATAMNFDWALAYTRLPENGETWPFELIRWTRSGGVTWGGEQVWQISNWGRLEFSGLTPAVKTGIREVLVRTALARYQKERNARTGGRIAIWKDEELGDPVFYREKLRPLVEKLDGYEKLVRPKMDAKTIDLLFLDAVPAWFDFQYFVDDLRGEYLEEHLMNGRK